jgi:hypothetical protein
MFDACGALVERRHIAACVAVAPRETGNAAKRLGNAPRKLEGAAAAPLGLEFEWAMTRMINDGFRLCPSHNTTRPILLLKGQRTSLSLSFSASPTDSMLRFVPLLPPVLRLMTRSHLWKGVVSSREEKYH